MEKILVSWAVSKWWAAGAAFLAIQLLPEESLWAKLSSIGLAGLIFFFYRQDRKDSEVRYEAIAKEHMQLIRESTVALTTLVANMKQIPCIANDERD